MPAKFVMKKGPTGKFRWSLMATNGKVIVSSESYGTKRAAMSSLESVRKNAGGATLDDQTDGAKAAAAGGSAGRKASSARGSAAKKTTASRGSAAKKTSATRGAAAKKTTAARRSSGGGATTRRRSR